MIFVNYPKCSTCRKAKKWLIDNNITFEDRDITLDNPSKEELKKWYEVSGLDIKKFFNTSGMVYRELGLKDKLKEMNLDEKLDILASNGMLVKRPILVSDDSVLVGFKQEQWESLLV